QIAIVGGMAVVEPGTAEDGEAATGVVQDHGEREGVITGDVPAVLIDDVPHDEVTCVEPGFRLRCPGMGCCGKRVRMRLVLCPSACGKKGRKGEENRAYQGF